MKLPTLIWCGVAGSLIVVAGVPATATGLSISFNNNGTITGNTEDTFPSLLPDNGPPIYLGVGLDGGPSDLGPFTGPTVAYSTETPNGTDVSGDLYIYCDPNHTDLMDILRFYAVGQQYIFVYSDLGGTALADNGFSSTLLSDVAGDGLSHLSVTAEDIGGEAGYTYTPTAGEPGFGGNITFTYTSDDAYGAWSAPDGGWTLALLGGTVGGLLALHRKLRA